ncbi:hypothetical protein Csa_022256, partial [Cucumis sativus]
VGEAAGLCITVLDYKLLEGLAPMVIHREEQEFFVSPKNGKVAESTRGRHPRA